MKRTIVILLPLVLVTGTAWAEECSEVTDWELERPIDAERFRQCCELQGDCGVRLAVVLANGWGGPRELRRARAILETMDASLAVAERESMIAFIDSELSSSAGEMRELLYCDHITSGFGGGVCAVMEQREVNREVYAALDAIARKLDTKQSAAFEELRTKAKQLIVEESGVRADGSRMGTAHAAFVLDEQMALTENFMRQISVYMAHGCQPAKTSYQDADQRLNRAYEAAMKGGDGIAKQQLRDAQRAWIAYRDAWVAFARATKNDSACMAVEQTMRRVRELEAVELTSPY